MIEGLVITVDKNVQPPGVRRKRGVDMSDPRVQQLQQLEIGDSFFVQGKGKKDVRPIIDTGRKIGVYLRAEDKRGDDEIYAGQVGVRIWRVEKPARTLKVKPVEPAAELVDGGEMRSTDSYWHHPESSCVILVRAGEVIRDQVDELCVEIDQATYYKLSAEYDDDL